MPWPRGHDRGIGGGSGGSSSGHRRWWICGARLRQAPSQGQVGGDHLIDRLNYSQFQPLLYQVATAQLGSSDVASPLRTLSIKHPNVTVKLGEVASIDTAKHSVTLTTGETYAGDYLVLAGGSQPNFFGVPGAQEHTFPLYSLTDAQRLRSRIISAFEDADRDASLVDQGALTFVIVGAGATGTEIAGALADDTARLPLNIATSRCHPRRWS